MVDILHRIAAKDVAPSEVFDALATGDGVASWWIGGTTGDGAVGATLRFGEGLAAEVVERRPDERVSWRVTEGPDEWLDTHIDFDIKQDGNYTVVLFKHAGWAEPIEFMHHCSTKWGVFMVSLKQLLETGTGAPTPNDVHIDNWS